jgi:hypothetical protein
LSYPVNRAFDGKSSTGQIGPGQYFSLLIQNESEGYLFCTSPRFSSTVRGKAENYTSFMVHEDPKPLTKLDLTPYKPDVRKFIIEESAKQRTLKETSVKKAKQDLDAQLKLGR